MYYGKTKRNFMKPTGFLRKIPFLLECLLVWLSEYSFWWIEMNTLKSRISLCWIEPTLPVQTRSIFLTLQSIFYYLKIIFEDYSVYSGCFESVFRLHPWTLFWLHFLIGSMFASFMIKVNILRLWTIWKFAFIFPLHCVLNYIVYSFI